LGKKADRDLNPRDRLLRRIGDINNGSGPCPLVTLEEFFEGNHDYGSIGYNLPDPPSPQEFYAFLLQVRSRADVRDVRIAVMDLPDPNGWPSTDTMDHNHGPSGRGAFLVPRAALARRSIQRL
jgi:hypothetical protein